ncbi:ATP-binding protein [Leisingera aquaemixtae]|uniref:Putative ATPase n=1 Tax=Leisingera aquaemixtae TaxID=1396826 RepID=A0A0P1HPL9_9RHOB|nr:ATP-binding protein [Leisingera aquaemixtae]CUI01875.1 putative ATPase [Leisingera aquaemixtae]
MRLLEQEEFESLIPDGVDVRPFVARQVRSFLNSKHYDGLETEVEKAEAFLRRVEGKKYANKILQRNVSGRSAPPDRSAPYWSMLKNWGRSEPRGEEDFARATLYYLLRDVGPPFYFIEVAKKVWDPRDLTFQKLFYAKFHDGPNAPRFKELCQRYYAKNDVIRRAFKEIWDGPYLGPPPVVRLGPISVSLGYQDGLDRLLVDDLPDQQPVKDGMVDVFGALSWRTRLSDLHGRQAEFDSLLDWALEQDDPSSARPKIALVSGPGGSGKSRLVADVVTTLVDQHGWTGGQIPSGDVNGRIFECDGMGAALIIDYPEARTDFVTEVLASVNYSHESGHPIRIILVSRENLEAWAEILNAPNPFWITEVPLGREPHISLPDALKISDDVVERLSAELMVKTPEITNREYWLVQNASHRLPLMILAASVHAVLDQKNAFSLKGKDVLLALAKIERSRVRSYSSRNFQDEKVLEKLLSLALFTDNGLNDRTIFDLGEYGLSSSMNGLELLEASQSTPFWRRASHEFDNGIVRLEPDIFATAFLYLVLGLQNRSDEMSVWLARTSPNFGIGFNALLSRTSFDLGYLDANASRNLEALAISMLTHCQDFTIQLLAARNSKSSLFSSEYSIALYKRQLSTTAEAAELVSIANNLALELHQFGELEEAQQVSGDAVILQEAILKEDPENELELFATVLETHSNIIADLGHLEDAITNGEIVAGIFENLLDSGQIKFAPRLAQAYHNLSVYLAKLKHYPEAMHYSALANELAGAEDSGVLPETIAFI